MTIFFTIDDISGRGGTERVVANLANAFSSHHRIIIITYHLYFSEISVLLPRNTQIINLEDIYGNFEPKGTIGKLKLCHYINKIIRANGGKSNALIANCNVFYPFFKRRDTKYIRLEHSKFAFLHHKYMDKKPLFPRVRFFDILVILSPNELSMWKKMHNNIKVIPNFLPTIPQVCTNHSQKVVLSVGRFSSEKGFLRLLDIWKMVRDKIVDCHDSALPNLAMTTPHPSLRGKAEAIQTYCHSEEATRAKNLQIKSDFLDSSPTAQNDNVANNLNEWKLIIVGDGILKDEIEAKIHALNLGQSVILKPFTKDIESEYLGVSIYAMSSHFEGFPMVLLESISYGLTPISFDIATGPSDIIENNKSGFLIADNDLETYADKLIALMNDESMRVRFGKEAKKIVEQRFSKESIMNLWADLFVDRL